VNTTSSYSANSTSITLTAALASAPTANKDYVMFSYDPTRPFLITAYNALTKTLTISPGLNSAISAGTSVTASVYSPYMNYSDCPVRPRHQFWFGAMTMIDWLGNYNLYTLAGNNAPHHWWPGNCHEAHAWACKVGVSSAIDDIK